LNGKVDDNGSNTLYHFFWGLNTNYGHSTPEYEIPAGSGSTPVSYPLTSLLPGTTYHYIVFAYNSDGSSSGNDVSFTTNAPAVPSLSVTPPDQPVSADAGTTSFHVSNTGGGTLVWSASVTDGTWLQITSGNSGTNTGTIDVSYSQNASTSKRVGTITVTASGATNSPQPVTVTQAGAMAGPVQIGNIYLQATTYVDLGNGWLSASGSVQIGLAGTNSSNIDQLIYFDQGAEIRFNKTTQEIDLGNSTWTTLFVQSQNSQFKLSYQRSDLLTIPTVNTISGEIPFSGPLTLLGGLVPLDKIRGSLTYNLLTKSASGSISFENVILGDASKLNIFNASVTLDPLSFSLAIGPQKKTVLGGQIIGYQFDLSTGLNGINLTYTPNPATNEVAITFGIGAGTALEAEIKDVATVALDFLPVSGSGEIELDLAKEQSGEWVGFKQLLAKDDLWLAIGIPIELSTKAENRQSLAKTTLGLGIQLDRGGIISSNAGVLHMNGTGKLTAGPDFEGKSGGASLGIYFTIASVTFNSDLSKTGFQFSSTVKAKMGSFFEFFNPSGLSTNTTFSVNFADSTITANGELDYVNGPLGAFSNSLSASVKVDLKNKIVTVNGISSFDALGIQMGSVEGELEIEQNGIKTIAKLECPFILAGVSIGTSSITFDLDVNLSIPLGSGLMTQRTQIGPFSAEAGGKLSLRPGQATLTIDVLGQPITLSLKVGGAKNARTQTAQQQTIEATPKIPSVTLAIGAHTGTLLVQSSSGGAFVTSDSSFYADPTGNLVAWQVIGDGGVVEKAISTMAAPSLKTERASSVADYSITLNAAGEDSVKTKFIISEAGKLQVYSYGENTASNTIIKILLSGNDSLLVLRNWSGDGLVFDTTKIGPALRFDASASGDPALFITSPVRSITQGSNIILDFETSVPVKDTIWAGPDSHSLSVFSVTQLIPPTTSLLAPVPYDPVNFRYVMATLTSADSQSLTFGPFKIANAGKAAIISAYATLGGTINPSGTFQLTPGADQTFSISPTAGHHVDSLVIDGISYGAVSSYTLLSVSTGTHTVTAYFSINTYQLTASANEGGTINPAGTVNVSYGEDEKFTFTPNVGYHFDSLLIDGVKNVDSTTSYTFRNVTTGHTIHAYFSANTFTITSSATNGTITPSASVNYGADQKFTYAPNVGYHFDSVLVDGTNKLDSTASYTFKNVTATHTIRVFFSINVFTIQVMTDGRGTVVPNGRVIVEYGQNAHFTITPMPCSLLDSLIVDGAPVALDTGYTFRDVISNHGIRAVFTVQYFIIIARSGSNGTIYPKDTVAVSCGDSITFHIHPNPGYGVEFLLVDGIIQAKDSVYTLRNIDRNHTLVVTFGLGIEDVKNGIPSKYSLYQNFPNPFNPTTSVRFDLPVQSTVFIAIYNVIGQMVMKLYEGRLEAGYKEISWDASIISSGMYFYRLDATSTADPTRYFSQTRKMLLVK
ncbi:MAG: T9SS type A sorting domain-containing protein, partial [Bacteroidota bacterium]